VSGFFLHPAAYADLDGIWEHIAADSLDAADRVLHDIDEAIHTLVAFPNSGHIRRDLSARLVRFLVVRDFLIAYAPEEDPLLVLAVVHGRRNPRAIAAIVRRRL
jgi:plasmid stabilization system protein ParE